MWPIWGFSGPMKQSNRLKIPTGRRQTCWLYTIAADQLNHAETTWNKSGRWSQRDLNSEFSDFKSGALTTWPRCLLPFIMASSIWLILREWCGVRCALDDRLVNRRTGDGTKDSVVSAPNLKTLHFIEVRYKQPQTCFMLSVFCI